MPQQMKLKGVNLGGWLVLEEWLTPSLFEGLNAHDEYSFCKELGDEASKRLEKHWSTFITKTDFKNIKKLGLNSIRIPIGYWIFDQKPPFVGNIKYLDWALEEALKNELSVIIDLHGAPGSQNGWDHSGRSGDIAWPTELNIQKTLETIERLAKRYTKSKSLVGIELLNEPHWDIPIQTLKDFYQHGYEIVRAYCDVNIAVIIHDSFRPEEFQDFMSEKVYKNVILDMHLYQCFSEADKKMNIDEHLEKTKVEWGHLISSSSLPVIIGEWSLGLDPKSLVGLSDLEQENSVKLYADAQINTFNEAQGSFFWTWKKESGDGWNFQDSLKRGLLPEHF